MKKAGAQPHKDQIKEILSNPELYNKFINSLFTDLDLDKNTYLDKKEVINFMKNYDSKYKNMEDIDSKTVDKFFHDIDLNKDGKISKDEFKLAFTNYLKKEL